MNSYKDPLVPLIADPINLDRLIQSIQVGISGLGWVEKCYGRAYDAVKRDTAGNKIVYPQVWQGPGLDLLNVLPNDNLKSQCFFKVEDPLEVVEYRPDGFSNMRARVSIIFWFNLQRVNPAFDYSYGELLKGTVMRLFNIHVFDSGDGFKIVRVWDQPKNVFAGYTLTEVRDQELIYPYGGFRVEAEVYFLENCRLYTVDDTDITSDLTLLSI